MSGAALVIFASACGAALIMLASLYRFRPVVFAKALRGADWLEIASPDIFSPGLNSLLQSFFLENGLGLVVLMTVSVITFVVWKRARFFGTAAPLLVGVLLFTYALRMHFSAYTFLFLALPFIVLFMAGVSV